MKKTRLINDISGQWFSVGRENCDIITFDDTIGRRHAELRLRADGKIGLRDLDSTNGSFHVSADGNETRFLEEEIELDLSETVRLGRVRYTILELLAELLGSKRDLMPALSQILPEEKVAEIVKAGRELPPVSGNNDEVVSPSNHQKIPEEPRKAAPSHGPRFDPETGDLINE